MLDEKVDELENRNRSSQNRNYQRENRSPTSVESERNRDRSRSPIYNLQSNYIDKINDVYDFERERTPTPIFNDIPSNFDIDATWNPNADQTVDTTNTTNTPFHVHRPFIMGALKNVGNSCYMNAVLYTLRFTPKFLHNFHHFFAHMIRFLHDMLEYPESYPPNTCYQQLAVKIFTGNKQSNAEVKIRQDVQDIISEVHEVFSKLTDTERVKRFEAIETNDLQIVLFKENPIFRPLTQQDSHEFLMYVLNVWRDCSDAFLNVIEKHPYLIAGISDPPTNVCFNSFKENFIGQKLLTRVCMYCDSKGYHYEDMVDLFIPLPNEGNVNENFIKTSSLTREQFNQTNKIKCEICNRNTDSVRITSFPRLPRILIVHLSRFDNHMNKINTVAPIPFQLDCFCTACSAETNVHNDDDDNNKTHQYHLYGIIIHLGSTLRNGHYITYLKSLNADQKLPFNCDSKECCELKLNQNNETENDLWYICDDDQITTVSEIDVKEILQIEATQKTPYILFYARNDLVTDDLVTDLAGSN